MTNRIFKYELKLTDIQLVQMPIGARILSVQIQDSKPCVWALVDDVAPVKPHLFQTFGTGMELAKDRGEYAGTYQLHKFVGHVFWRLQDAT